MPVGVDIEMDGRRNSRYPGAFGTLAKINGEAMRRRPLEGIATKHSRMIV